MAIAPQPLWKALDAAWVAVESNLFYPQMLNLNGFELRMGEAVMILSRMLENEVDF